MNDIWLPTDSFTGHKISDGIAKICAVIESCETEDHIQSTRRMIKNFEQYHKSNELTAFLYEELNIRNIIK
jgi:hypothetical protein